MLELTRPLISFDLETTGFKPGVDRIVQLAVIKTHIHDDGYEDKEWETYINPGIPIPPSSTAVHRITDEMVKDAPRLEDIGAALIAGFEGCDVLGFNHKPFDMPFLEADLKRAGFDFKFNGCAVIDAYRLWLKVKPRNLSMFVMDTLGEPLIGAHSALVDTRGALHGVRRLLELYPNVPRTPQGLHDYLYAEEANLLGGGKFRFREDGVLCMNFGKFKDVPVDDPKVKGYLNWMLTGNFSAEVYSLCEDILDGRTPTRAR
jgi:DNA polymerase-3 subunit epsilon